MPRSLLWPDPRVKPPFGAAEVDWAHPLARALDLCLLFNESGGHPFSLAGNGQLTHTGTWNLTSRGVGIATSGSPQSAILTGTPRVTTVPLTLSMLAVVTQNPNSDALVLANTATEGNSFGLYVQQGPPKTVATWAFSGSYNQATGTTTVAVNQGVHIHGVQATAASRIVYLNGRSDGTSTTSITPTGINTFGIGILNRLTPIYYPTTCSAAWVWGQALSSDLVLWHAAEPYAMLRPIVRRRYFVFHKVGPLIHAANPQLITAGGSLGGATL